MLSHVQGGGTLHAPWKTSQHTHARPFASVTRDVVSRRFPLRHLVRTTTVYPSTYSYSYPLYFGACTSVKNPISMMQLTHFAPQTIDKLILTKLLRTPFSCNYLSQTHHDETQYRYIRLITIPPIFKPHQSPAQPNAELQTT